MYKAAIHSTTMAEVPYYWHTNYALACERMLQIDHTFNKDSLLEETIFHFEKTLEKNPADKDAHLIKLSIKSLKEHVGKIK